jgi:hypothetical protein
VTLYDRIFELEGKLDQPGLDFLGRRLALRRAFEAVRADALKEGYQDGMHDATDARHADELAAKEAGGG